MSRESLMSPSLTLSQRPKLTAARRRVRRLLATILGIFYVAIIVMGVVLWLSQQTPNWDLTFVSQRPQPLASCQSPGQSCQDYWTARSGISSLTDNTPLTASSGVQICAYYPQQNGKPSYITSSTTEQDLLTSFGFVLVDGNGNCNFQESSNVVQTSVATWLQMIVYVAVAIVSGLMGVLIFLHATRRRLVGRALIALSSLAVSFVFIPISAIGSQIFGAIDIVAVSYIAPPFFASMIWLLVLPEPAPHQRWRNWLDGLITLFLPIVYVSLAFAYLTNVLVQSTHLAAFDLLSRAIINLVSLLIALLAGLVGTFLSQSPLRRDSARILSVGMFIAFIPLLAVAVVPTLLALPPSSTNTYLATLSVIALPLALAYVVLKTDILGVDSLVRVTTDRVLRVVGVIAVAALFLVVILVVPQIASDVRDVLLLAAMIFVGLLSPAIQAGMSWFTEVLIFPEVRRFRRVLARAAAGTGVAEPREIATELIGEVRLALPVRQVALFVRNNETGRFARVPDDAEPDALLTFFDANHFVPVQLRRRGSAVSIADIVDQAVDHPATSYPPTPIGADPTSGWDLFVPIRVGDELIGFLALGPRDDEYIYSSTDRSLLLTLVNRRALALDYARILVDLRLAYEQQKELDRLKDQFIMTTHHELRTPLTGLLGYLELLSGMGTEGRRRSPEDADYFIGAATRAGTDLERLMTTLLEADQQTINRARIHPELLDVHSVIQAAAESVDMAFDRYQRRIVIRCEPDLHVWADPQATSRVLTNLLTNALKYSPQDSPVLVTGHRHHDAETVEILVRDWGSGITPADQPKIFERFVRLERDLNSPVRGTGLGLYVARSLIESMGGRLWVESAGIPGVGSTFRIVLPINLPAEGEAQSVELETAGTQSRPTAAHSGV